MLFDQAMWIDYTLRLMMLLTYYRFMGLHSQLKKSLYSKILIIGGMPCHTEILRKDSGTRRVKSEKSAVEC